MNRKTDKRQRFPGYYRHDLLNKCRESLDLTVRGIAIRLNKNQDTAIRVFNGTASQKMVWPYAKYFGIKWSELHNLDLPIDELHRVALNGNSRAVR